MDKLKTFVRNPDLGLLIYRLFFGLTMAFAHGWMKLPPSQQLIDGVGAMGFPAPLFFSWCATLAEFIGALLIAVGLLTRLSAATIALTMAIAGFVAHASDPFRVKELAFVYLATSVMFIFTGAGQYSLDRVLCKK